jgi:DNA-binding SARP family transcriptional activator
MGPGNEKMRLSLLSLMRATYVVPVLLSIFVFSFTERSAAQSYGLRFASYEVVQDNRTSLDLTPEKTLCPGDAFELSFDISFDPNQRIYFGYVVRIIENDSRNIDLIYDTGGNVNNGHFKVIAGDKSPNLSFSIKQPGLFLKWNKVKLKIDPKKKLLTVFDGLKTYTQPIDVQPGACYKILFGANHYGSFETTDVPPMKLRNVSLSEEGKVKYVWPLNEEDGTRAAEHEKNFHARVENPVWVKKMHHTWQTRKKLWIPGMVNIAMDAKKELLYIIGEDSLHTYSIPAQTFTSARYKSGRLHLAKGNRAFYDTTGGKLYSYNVDQKIVASYDFQKQAWDQNFTFPIPENSTLYWHANKYYSPQDSSLYTFGGYGQLTFKNSVFRYHFPTKTWSSVAADSSIFTPRYLAGGGATPEGMYILGGFGSATGQQILNPRNWHDLIFFDRRTQKFRKVYEIETDHKDFTFANSLITAKNHFYALVFQKNTYNSSLQLVSGSLDKPGFKVLASKIPYSFHDTHSFADLFYCPVSKILVAVTMTRAEDDKATAIAVYTLNTPVLDKSTSISTAESGIPVWLTTGALLLLLFSTGTLAYYYVGRKKKILRSEYGNGTTPKASVKTPENYAASAGAKPDPEKYRNQILLFGDMQLFDEDGTEITHYFTPLIKELFLVILLYTIRWGRGLNSEKLKELLWSDKSTESARNNRSVNLTKLKNILNKMKHCQVVMAGGHWKIDFDPDRIRVDYLDYLTIIKMKNNIDRQAIGRLIDITRKGSFLSNVEYEWLDTFKSEISNEIVTIYLQFASSFPISEDPEFMIDLANNIFYFDQVNEEAMILKCRTLAYLGKHSLAKSAFSNFAKDYSAIYGESFKKALPDILNTNV